MLCLEACRVALVPYIWEFTCARNTLHSGSALKGSPDDLPRPPKCSARSCTRTSSTLHAHAPHE
eukprot:2160022-Amphidinium_carterae.1